MSKNKIRKWSGGIVTAILSIVALSPCTFGIPELAHPWIFLAAFVWLFLFVTGFFNL